MPLTCSVLFAERTGVHRIVVVPSSRQTSSSLVKKLKVCSGLLAVKVLVGKSDANRLSCIPPAGIRFRKLGGAENATSGLVLELSFLDKPRLDRLWVPSRLTWSWKPLPSS